MVISAYIFWPLESSDLADTGVGKKTKGWKTDDAQG